MVDIQVYCFCGYSVRLSGKSLDEDLAKEGFHCPLCQRDLLLGKGLLHSHPTIRRLEGKGFWNLPSNDEEQGPPPEWN